VVPPNRIVGGEPASPLPELLATLEAEPPTLAELTTEPLACMLVELATELLRLPVRDELPDSLEPDETVPDRMSNPVRAPQ
jgi:hypothetical protein